MLVKVNERYKGVYGYVDRELDTVKPKRAGDPPFDVPKDMALRHIENGVLVAVEGAPASVKPAPTVKDPEPVIAEEPVKEEVKDYDNMSIAELRDAAKERGIASFGRKKTDLIKLIKEYDRQGGPEIVAADPV